MWLENPMLVINDVTLPPVSRDRYSAPLVALESSREAIDGTVIREHRGWRRQINYEIDYLGNDLMRQLMAALRSGRELVVQFLPDDDDYPQTMGFFCTRYPQPRAAFAKNGVLLWHNISFTLESVKVVSV